MYLHVGNNKSLRLKEIIGIFDMDTATMSLKTQTYLKSAEKQGKTETLFDDVPKSFIVTDDGKVYFSQISVTSLMGRI